MAGLKRKCQVYSGQSKKICKVFLGRDRTGAVFTTVHNGGYRRHCQRTRPQNYGYDGYDSAALLWETWQEAVEDEDRIE